MADLGLSAGLLIAATVVSAAAAAYGTYSYGEQQAKAARYNEQVAEQQAKSSVDAASIQESNFREEARRRQASARAAIGASGVTSEGSPLLVLMDNAQAAELEAQRIKYGGAVAATGYRNEGQLMGFYSNRFRTAGMVGAGTSLLASTANIGRIAYTGSPARVQSSELMAP